MEKEIANYVDKCLICQKVKAEHQRPVGELRPLDMPIKNVTRSQWIFFTCLPPFNYQEECHLGNSRSID